VEVVTDAGQRLIFDCGTGARPLGVRLMAREPKPITATILLSHTHWDHIQGFPFFAPLFVPGNRFLVCGPQGASRSLPEVLAGQMEYTYFPVELGQLGADIQYRDLVEGTYEFSGVRVYTRFLNHPAAALGYRVEADGVSLLYLCDHEPFWESLWQSDREPGNLDSILHNGDRQHAEFMQNADVVIHDAQYTPEEYPAKRNWGHSTYSYVIQMAGAANVKNLFLTHHDPTHDDGFLAGLEERARELARSLPSQMKVSCAYEGCEERIQPGDSAEPKADTMLTAEWDQGRPLRVLVVDDDEDLRILVRKALVQGGHQVWEAAGGAEALRLLERGTPDLVLLDLNMPPPDGHEVLRVIRSRENTRSIPVVVLTAHGDEQSARTSFELGATDFLPKPFTPPQLNARVRSSFAHAARP
jgi:CheY-like chemotaxis protein